MPGQHAAHAHRLSPIMRISVSTSAGCSRVDRRRIRRLFHFLLCKAGRRSHRVWGDISLVLLDDVAIRRINHRHLGHDSVTDVISFVYAPVPGQGAATTSGEILVNAELAERMGGIFLERDRELALYIAHGCDHLAGAEDNTLEQRHRMRRREHRWLEEALRLDLVKGLYRL